MRKKTYITYRILEADEVVNPDDLFVFQWGPNNDRIDLVPFKKYAKGQKAMECKSPVLRRSTNDNHWVTNSILVDLLGIFLFLSSIVYLILTR